jgi:hypothetical protein
VATFVNSGFARSGIFENWVRSVERVGLRDRIFVGAVDSDALSVARSFGLWVVELKSIGIESASSRALRFKEQGWKAVMYRKLIMMRALLSAGKSVLYSDADVVFRRNPMPFFPPESATDMAFQSDAPAGARNPPPQVLCAGFFFAHPTSASIEVLTFDSDDYDACSEDQACLRRRVSHVSGVRIAMLSDEDFPNGRVWQERPPANPVAVHLNFAFCIEDKIELAKRTGLWLLEGQP